MELASEQHITQTILIRKLDGFLEDLHRRAEHISKFTGWATMTCRKIEIVKRLCDDKGWCPVMDGAMVFDSPS